MSADEIIFMLFVFFFGACLGWNERRKLEERARPEESESIGEIVICSNGKTLTVKRTDGGIELTEEQAHGDWNL